MAAVSFLSQSEDQVEQDMQESHRLLRSIIKALEQPAPDINAVSEVLRCFHSFHTTIAQQGSYLLPADITIDKVQALSKKHWANNALQPLLQSLLNALCRTSESVDNSQRRENTWNPQCCSMDVDAEQEEETPKPSGGQQVLQQLTTQQQQVKKQDQTLSNHNLCTVLQSVEEIHRRENPQQMTRLKYSFFEVYDTRHKSVEQMRLQLSIQMQSLSCSHQAYVKAYGSYDFPENLSKNEVIRDLTAYCTPSLNAAIDFLLALLEGQHHAPRLPEIPRSGHVNPGHVAPHWAAEVVPAVMSGVEDLATAIDPRGAVRVPLHQSQYQNPMRRSCQQHALNYNQHSGNLQ